MSEAIDFKQITKEELDAYKGVLLPMIYEELSQQDDIETEYIGIAATEGEKVIGAIVAEPDDDGDLTLLSVWVVPEKRNEGVASQLLQKMLYVAYRLYNWEDGQYGDDITLKTMYCLADEYREPFEKWLEKNDFTDFYITRTSRLGQPDICTASAEIHMYRYE